MKSAKIPTWLLAVLAIAGIVLAVLLLTKIAPTEVVGVKCAPYLAQVYRLEGEPANVSIVVKDSTEKDVIAGANLYLFEEEPYYWGKVNKFANIGREIAGKTPVGTSDGNGKLFFTVSVPFADEKEKTYYAVLAASGYWTELFNLKVGFTPVLTAPTQAECIALYKKTDITAADLIDVSLVRVLDNSPVKLSEVLLDKIGTLDYSNTVSLGINADEVAKEMTKTVNIYVNDGYARIEAVEFKKLIEDLTSEGIKRIEVEVRQGATTLLKEVLFDEYDTETPLAEDDTKTFNEIGNKDLLVLQPNTGISIVLKVIADTEATAASGSGKLGPGEQFLQISLKLAHPQEASPATITITG